MPFLFFQPTAGKAICTVNTGKTHFAIKAIDTPAGTIFIGISFELFQFSLNINTVHRQYVIFGKASLSGIMKKPGLRHNFHFSILIK